MSSFFLFLQDFFETVWTWIVPSFFKVLLIVLISFFALHLINLATDNFVRKSKKINRAETLRQISYSTSRTIITTIAIMMILHEFGFDIRPIIASAGILGLAVSFGAQNLMRDVINGFFILLEDQFSIGDTVKISEHSGIVEKMNLRTTTLKDSLGNIHIIPNSQINQVTILNGKQ